MKYPCPFPGCSKEYRKECNFKCHFTDVHDPVWFISLPNSFEEVTCKYFPDNLIFFEIIVTRDPETEKFKCPFLNCSSQFGTQKAIKMHMSSNHGDSKLTLSRQPDVIVPDMDVESFIAIDNIPFSIYIPLGRGTRLVLTIFLCIEGLLICTLCNCGIYFDSQSLNPGKSHIANIHSYLLSRYNSLEIKAKMKQCSNNVFISGISFATL
jgi:hypothetical protein